MANILSELFQNIADSIRAKTGDVATMKPAEFPEKISTIETQPETEEKTVDITENGPVEVTPEEGKLLTKVTANVNVPIPEGYIKPEGEVEITKNGPVDVTDKASVNVNVPIPEGYIKPEGEVEITENGPVDVKQYESAVVNVPSSGGSGFYLTEENESGGVTYHFTAEESGSGGAEFNIAYGDTEPEDTSKLWVKTAEPSNLIITSGDDLSRVESIKQTDITLPFSVGGGTAFASVGTKIYCFGGYYNKAYHDTIQCFDTETNTTETLSAIIAEPMGFMSVVSVGTKIYLFGGFDDKKYSSTIQCFDTETNTIETLSTTLPSAANRIGVVCDGTKVYLIGGQYGEISSHRLSTINCFDTETNTISTVANLPTAEGGIGVASVGTKIYCFGGDGSGGRKDKIVCFDTVSKAVETLSTTLPQYTYCIAASSDGTKIYLFGGHTGGSALSTINCFNTETNTISTLSTSLPVAATVHTARVGTKIYLFSTSFTTLTYFAVLFELSQGNMLIDLSLTDNKFNLINSGNTIVTVGVKSVSVGNAEGIGEQVEAALHDGTSWVTI